MSIYMPKTKIRYLLVKYWQLKNTEISLAERHFWLLLVNQIFPKHACSFCRMLKTHKDFPFTQIPDKTNDIIFLKSPKNPFLGHFLPFFLIVFSENPALSHITIYGPLTPCKVSEKTHEPILRKFMDRQKVRWKDRQTDPSSQGWGSKKRAVFVPSILSEGIF